MHLHTVLIDENHSCQLDQLLSLLSDPLSL